MVPIVSPRFTVITMYCLRIGRGNGRSRPPRHLKTKFTPLNRAVRSLSTHPTANLAPAVTSLPTWRAETFEFSSLPLPCSLSSLHRCLYRGFLTRVPGHPSRANYPKQIRRCLLRANLIRACVGVAIEIIGRYKIWEIYKTRTRFLLMTIQIAINHQINII